MLSNLAINITGTTVPTEDPYQQLLDYAIQLNSWQNNLATAINSYVNDPVISNVLLNNLSNIQTIPQKQLTNMGYTTINVSDTPPTMPSLPNNSLPAPMDPTSYFSMFLQPNTLLPITIPTQQTTLSVNYLLLTSSSSDQRIPLSNLITSLTNIVNSNNKSTDYVSNLNDITVIQNYLNNVNTYITYFQNNFVLLQE